MKTLGIITARKNSQRLPNKNKLLLGGKPLICWTIESALEANCLDFIAIISDDPAIHDIVFDSYYGARVIMVYEPAEYGTDGRHIDAIIYGIHDVIDSMLHIEEPVDLEELEIVLTQTTSPFRTGRDIDFFYDIFKFERKPVAAVNPYWKACGAIYMIKYRELMNMRSFHGPYTRYIPLPIWNSWDIDTKEQFEAARHHYEGSLK